MLKKIINVLWTYSPEDYWRTAWSKTSLDEKAVATVMEIKKRYKLTAVELADVGRALKQVGNQIDDIPNALKGKKRKGRKLNMGPKPVNMGGSKQVMARIVTSSYTKPRRTKRPGVHAKTRTSKVKSSRNYKKKYRGQGK